MPKEVMVGVDM